MSEFQEVTNSAAVNHQVNVNSLNGDVQMAPVSRLGQRFKKLKEEVEKDIRSNDFIEDFKHYNTELDGKSMPDKLRDGNFNEKEILKATYRKHMYSKKLEKNQLYETAQRIDMEIFSLINTYFETYVEPLIDSGADKALIKTIVLEKVVQPIVTLINQDGRDDTFLNYNMDDIYGMVFFLTGKCHLNWTNYDRIQPGI